MFVSNRLWEVPSLWTIEREFRGLLMSRLAQLEFLLILLSLLKSVNLGAFYNPNQFPLSLWQDDRLNAKELMNLFNSVLNKDYHLPLETCRQLIFGEDTTGRSSLTREQTEALLSSLRNLQAMFLKFDEDSSGTMSPFELSTALEAVGMQCDGKVVQLLSARFAAGELQMPFHGFVSCVTRLRMLFALYKSETIHEVKDRGINQWLLQFLLV